MALPDYSNYQFPSFNTGGNFPYQDFLQQLQASFWAQPMNSYGRFSGTGVTTPQGYPAPMTTPNGPPGGYGSGGLLKSAPGPASAPPMQPQGGGPAPSAPQPGSGAGDPGFGAAPSSASFANLTDADRTFLWMMENQYRQDLRNQPGAHQLYKDLFGDKTTPQELSGFINDSFYNNPLATQNFDVNAYQGPMRALYENAVKSRGGTVHPYGTWTGLAAAQADALRRFGPNLVDFRTAQRMPNGLVDFRTAQKVQPGLLGGG